MRRRVVRDVRRPRLLDVLSEAVASLRGNLTRSVLTGAGVVLASGAFVVISGLTDTLSRQVSADFDSLRATEVAVGVSSGDRPTPWTEPADLGRLRELPGVVAAGVLARAEVHRVHRAPDTLAREIDVRPVDAEALRVIGPAIGSGRAFDAFHVVNRSPVIMLSRSTARRLQVARPGGTVDLDGRLFTVIGIYDGVRRRSETLLQGLVPLGSLGSGGGADATAEVVAETAPGAAAAVAANAPLALHPEDPRALVAAMPLDPTQFRKGVESNVRRLALGAIAVALVMGVASLANATTAAIYSRTAEIGLRGVVGAQPRHVFAQLLAETAFLGLVGGAVGSAVGFVTVVGIATWNGWGLVASPGAVLLALALSTGAGLVAGLGPAWRATRIQPVDALRR